MYVYKNCCKIETYTLLTRLPCVLPIRNRAIGASVVTADHKGQERDNHYETLVTEHGNSCKVQYTVVVSLRGEKAMQFRLRTHAHQSLRTQST